MENTTVQPTPPSVPATNTVPPAPKPVAPPPVPSIDPKASLKIETAPTDDAPKVNYGEKLFILGVLFCTLIVIGTVVVAYFWSQKSNQIQKPVTIEQSK